MSSTDTKIIVVYDAAGNIVDAESYDVQWNYQLSEVAQRMEPGDTMQVLDRQRLGRDAKKQAEEEARNRRIAELRTELVELDPLAFAEPEPIAPPPSNGHDAHPDQPF